MIRRWTSRHWFLPVIPNHYDPEWYEKIKSLCMLCSKHILDDIHFTTGEFQ